MQETKPEIEGIPATGLFSEKPMYVLGPCSAESREQVVETAVSIANHFPKSIFRAGIWKPRTRPGNFEGIGELGLSWLREAGDKSGLKVATEVANTRHVELALKNDIDVLWVGARTTVNPFYVQEIAEALKGMDIPIMVKNPLAPDFSLWLGAVERFEKVGTSQVIAIHRGFHHYDSKPYRNLPQWEIPIQLMAERPDLPILCDISHIGGDRALLAGIAQKAMDLNMNGLHIEVHPDPAEALSDSRQQITTDQLLDLISGIEWREATTDNQEFHQSLRHLRSEVDSIDQDVLKAFFRRMESISRIGALKKKNKVTVLQVKRWKKIEDHYLTEGKALGLSEEFLTKLLHIIHDESMRIQHDIMNR